MGDDQDRERSENAQRDRAEHLRGIRGRRAEDTGQGHPRPDESGGPPPAGVQSTHAGIPTHDPLAEPLDDSSAGRDATIMADRDQPPRQRYRGHGDDAEGAFAEEQPE